MAKSAAYYNEVHKTWDTWHASGSPTYYLRTHLLRRVVRRYLVPPAVILDFGCGNGDHIPLLLTPAGQVDGVDFSDGALDIARRRFGTDRRVHLFQEDIFTFTPERQYSLILISEVLEHLDNDQAALARTRDWLTDDGTVVVTVPFNKRLWSYSDQYAGHRRRYSSAEVRQLAVSANFHLERIIPYGFPFLWLYWLLTKSFRPAMAHGRPSTSILHRIASLALRGCTYIDRLFFWVPNGVGVIVVLKKHTP